MRLGFFGKTMGPVSFLVEEYIHLESAIDHSYHLLTLFLSGPSSSSSSLSSAYCVFGCVAFQAFVNNGSFSANSAYFNSASRGSSSLILLSGMLSLICASSG